MTGSEETQTGTAKIQAHHETSWIDVQNPSSEVFAKLEHDYHLHPVHLNESVQKIQHTLLLSEADGQTTLDLTSEVLSAGPDAAPFLGGMEPGLGQALAKRLIQ